MHKTRLLSSCFKPSKPQRIIQGLKQAFIKRYLAKRTNKAETRLEEHGEKEESCRRIYGMKYSWKSHKDTRNRQKNRKKKGVGKLGWFISKTSTATAPPREGEPAGTTKQGILKTYARNNGHIQFTKHPLPQNKKTKKQKIDCVFAENWCFDEISSFTKIRGINCSLIYCERTSQRYYTLWSSQSENQLWCKQCTLVMVDIDETSKQNAGIY